jgi:hypothetical protein
MAKFTAEEKIKSVLGYKYGKESKGEITKRSDMLVKAIDFFKDRVKTYVKSHLVSQNLVIMHLYPLNRSGARKTLLQQDD